MISKFVLVREQRNNNAEEENYPVHRHADCHSFCPDSTGEDFW
jgi:hypothetical protein